MKYDAKIKYWPKELNGQFKKCRRVAIRLFRWVNSETESKNILDSFGFIFTQGKISNYQLNKTKNIHFIQSKFSFHHPWLFHSSGKQLCAYINLIIDPTMTSSSRTPTNSLAIVLGFEALIPKLAWTRRGTWKGLAIETILTIIRGFSYRGEIVSFAPKADFFTCYTI